MKHIRPLTIVKALLVLVLLAGVIGMVLDQADKRQGAQDYAQAAELAGGPTVPETQDPAPAEEAADPNLAQLAETDLAALQATNPDVVGWLWVPGTEISYPIVQGQDNDYYLKHTWTGSYSAVGSIFLDCRNDGFQDFNTLIYGHRMRNETMFGPLKHYQDPAFLASAPWVYVLDQEGPHRYDIFAAYEADVDSLLYTAGLTQPGDQLAVLNEAAALSVLDTGLAPTTDDQILTLITCTGNGYAQRWVIQAVKIV